MFEELAAGSAITLLLVSSACSSDDHVAAKPPAQDGGTSAPAPTGLTGPNASTSVDGSGGVVTTADNRVRVTIPPGALAVATTITIAPGSSSVAGALGTIYEIGPTGTQFAQPVKIAITYNDADLAGQSLDTVAVSTVEGGAWKALANTVRDATARTVQGETTHLSPYALASAAGTMPKNGPDCPANAPQAGAATCVAGTTCSYIAQGGGGTTHTYCSGGTVWESTTFADNANCPAAATPDGVCDPSLTSVCAYYVPPDSGNSCKCLKNAVGEYRFSCHKGGECAAATNAGCNGTVPPQDYCPLTAVGTSCAEYCRYASECRALPATCQDSGQGYARWVSGTQQVVASTSCTQ